MSNKNFPVNTTPNTNPFPQLPSHVNPFYIPTLCIACSKTCATCQYLHSYTPIPNWNAQKTLIKETQGPYTSYRVLSCPCYTPTQDYYSNESDLKRLLKTYIPRLSYHWFNNYGDAIKEAWEEYQVLCPRSKPKAFEERQAIISALVEKKIKEEKNRRKSEKSVKNI